VSHVGTCPIVGREGTEVIAERRALIKWWENSLEAVWPDFMCLLSWTALCGWLRNCWSKLHIEGDRKQQTVPGELGLFFTLLSNSFSPELSV